MLFNYRSAVIHSVLCSAGLVLKRPSMVSVFPFCRWFLCSCFPNSSPSASLPKMKIYSSERAGYPSRSSRPEGDTTGQSPACNVFGILLLKVPTLYLQSVLISCCPCRSYRPNLGLKLCISKRQSVPAHHWSQHSECRRFWKRSYLPFPSSLLCTVVGCKRLLLRQEELSA